MNQLSDDSSSKWDANMLKHTEYSSREVFTVTEVKDVLRGQAYYFD